MFDSVKLVVFLLMGRVIPHAFITKLSGHVINVTEYSDIKVTVINVYSIKSVPLC